MKDRFKQYLARRMRAYATKLDPPPKGGLVVWPTAYDTTSVASGNCTVIWKATS